MQGHPEDPDPLYGALAFSKSEMASMPLFDPGRIAGYKNLDIWPRCCLLLLYHSRAESRVI